MDKIKKMIIICIIFIMVIAIIIYVLISMKPKQEQTDEQNLTDESGNYMEDYQEEYIAETSAKKVKDKNKYYTVKNIIDTYFEQINMLHETDEAEKSFIQDEFMDMYSNNYIDEFKITADNLETKLEEYFNCEYSIKDMYVIEKSLAVNIFLVDINIINKNAPDNMIIVMDSANSAYEIYADEYVKKYKYNENMEKLNEMTINDLKITPNNKIKGVIVSNQDIAISYFNNYKYNMLNNIEQSYNLLDPEYKKARFTDIKEYEQYINENRDIIKDINPVQYLYNQYEDYNEYVCKDQHENIYIFKETAIMDYTVLLDTYTIMTKEFREEYLAGNDNKKSIMNIDKFIQMINNYDFNAAYELLNKTFRENNFKSVEEFKKYIQNTYYRYNDIKINSYTDENGVYVYKTIISNKENEEETKEMDIIIKLNDGTDFEMSFEII